MAGKFESVNDEILYALCVEGWAKKSTGSDDFGASLWLIENDAADVGPDNTEFSSLLDTLDLGLDTTARTELVGAFIVVLAENGSVTVIREAPELARHHFSQFEESFDRWATKELHGE